MGYILDCSFETKPSSPATANISFDYWIDTEKVLLVVCCMSLLNMCSLKYLVR